MGLSITDSFKDVFARIPQLNVNPPDPASGAGGGFTGGGFSPAVEQYRGLVSQYFPADVVNEALSVMECESSGNPNARNAQSGATGLFQHLPKYWDSRSRAAGIPGANIFDPNANVKVAGWLYSQSGTWDHWECKPEVVAKAGGGSGGGGGGAW